MKTFATLVTLAAVGSSSAFAPTAPSTRPSFSLSMAADESANLSRRSALLSIGGVAASFAATAVSPYPAFADESSDDMVARIAAKSVAANEAARLKKEKEDAAKAKGKESGGIAVLGVGAAGVALTAPFFLPNLLRLGSKLSSGGEDDGYGAKRK
mmetsp:Transcript_45549/g.138428  ORF Transcript_45549/g.138428 Transcript_45549/m.138428 type:complete len:155 (-) Transcript_45549:1202-1666(-)|eukprot:CAMPEP_0113539974 /NCGR_PEP_ID=MMETSP0015_2-20120614/8223_1 /TAXON_ID=2838 /ORGANISM="Odontella" /LENGTH=154 /DNA_ID=CAMNT_0000439727 /DNA_START=332 /DNA_END=796 /DNA_ORIENTATION=+ /assembly_acc=CAM_ASM_000160